MKKTDDLKKLCMIETAITFNEEGVDYAIDTPLFVEAYSDLYNAIMEGSDPVSWDTNTFNESVERMTEMAINLTEEAPKSFINKAKETAVGIYNNPREKFGPVGHGVAIGGGVGALGAAGVWAVKRLQLRKKRQACNGNAACEAKVDAEIKSLRKKALVGGALATAAGAAAGAGAGMKYKGDVKAAKEAAAKKDFEAIRIDDLIDKYEKIVKIHGDQDASQQNRKGLSHIYDEIEGGYGTSVLKSWPGAMVADTALNNMYQGGLDSKAEKLAAKKAANRQHLAGVRDAGKQANHEKNTADAAEALKALLASGSGSNYQQTDAGKASTQKSMADALADYTARKTGSKKS